MQQAHTRKIAVIGLGYVGLSVAVGFGRMQPIIGFDVNAKRVEQLSKAYDKNKEFSSDTLLTAQIQYTTDASTLKSADFYIIAVPTPITSARQPDLNMLILASKLVAEQLKQGDIVVYESTVYPGVTEEECLPILEKYSGLKAGADFTVGYSPERINPGDPHHSFTTITKIVSAQDEPTLEIIAAVYSSVIKGGIYKASSIKVAEAAKVIENTQRDVNVALMNELAMIFNILGIDTHEVLKAAGTKWNFLPFQPGLVGGHCIGIDPYYLTHKAVQYGYHPEIILAGRRINDNMGIYIATQLVKQMVRVNRSVRNARIAILGLSFKEDCSDLRNSKVIDIIKELQSYGVELLVHDPVVISEDAFDEFSITLAEWDSLQDLDALILAVPHQYYKELQAENFIKKLKPQAHFIDIKSVFSVSDFSHTNLNYWSL